MQPRAIILSTALCMACAASPGGTTQGRAVTIQAARATTNAPREQAGQATPVATIAAGSQHVCAIGSDTRVYCWGSNGDGQLGNDTRTASSKPVVVPGIEGAFAVASGLHFSCALHAERELTCWGRHPGQARSNPPSPPTKLVDAPALETIAAGYGFVCGLDAEAHAHCLGAHGLGRNSLARPSRRWTRVPDIADAVELGATLFGSCVRTVDGSVWCWGGASDGHESAPSPVRIHGVHASALGTSAGGLPCARSTDGEAQCWDGDGVHPSHPDSESAGLRYPVLLTREQQESSTGSGFACARGADGVFCSGRAYSAAIGVNPPPFMASPQPVNAAIDLTRIAAGGSRTCEQVRDGSVACVDFIDGAIAELPHVLPFSASSSSSGCVAERSGVTCVGTNWDGSLGVDPDSQSPVGTTRVHHDGILNVVDLAQYRSHSCAVDGNGGLTCWGDNSSHQISPTMAARWLPPTPIKGLPIVREVGVGMDATCVLDQGGLVHCWGAEGAVLLAGNGLRDVAQLEIASTTGCVRTHSKRLLCWGRGPQQPKRVTGSPIAPVDVGLDGVADFGLGFAHGCALAEAGKVYCWGDGQSGQVGQGQPRDEATPVEVLNDATALAVGGTHTCATRQDGQLWCWGAGTPGSGPYEVETPTLIELP